MAVAGPAASSLVAAASYAFLVSAAAWDGPVSVAHGRWYLALDQLLSGAVQSCRHSSARRVAYVACSVLGLDGDLISPARIAGSNLSSASGLSIHQMKTWTAVRLATSANTSGREMRPGPITRRRLDLGPQQPSACAPRCLFPHPVGLVRARGNPRVKQHLSQCRSPPRVHGENHHPA